MSRAVEELQAILSRSEASERIDQAVERIRAQPVKHKGQPFPKHMLRGGVFHVEPPAETGEEQTRVCAQCKRERPIVLFPPIRKTRKDGARNLLCQLCIDSKIEKSRTDLPPLPRPPQSVIRRATNIWNAARLRAWRFGLPFSLRQRWVLARLLEGKCQVTGLQFMPPDAQGEKRKGGPKNFSATIDREVPEKGYTEDNCRMVVWLYNSAKGAGTHEDVLLMAKALIKETSARQKLARAARAEAEKTVGEAA